MARSLPSIAPAVLAFLALSCLGQLCGFLGLLVAFVATLAFLASWRPSWQPWLSWPLGGLLGSLSRSCPLDCYIEATKKKWKLNTHAHAWVYSKKCGTPPSEHMWITLVSRDSEKGTPQTGSHQICYNRPLPGIAYVQCLGSLGNPGGLGEAGYVDGLSTSCKDG